jgi:hypothetical protein
MTQPAQPKQPPAVIVLTLTPAPGNYQAPPEKRLARLLKTMLRAYGWPAAPPAICPACSHRLPEDAPDPFTARIAGGRSRRRS